MKNIGIEEIHKRILKIADVFDRICSEYDIPYYMLGGTMLGAIRHKRVFDVNLPIKYKHIYSINGEHLFKTQQDLVKGLADSKITVCYPCCDTQPEKAGNI